MKAVVLIAGFYCCLSTKNLPPERQVEVCFNER